MMTRTHCGRGHLLDEVNSYIRPSNKAVVCRECRRESSKGRIRNPPKSWYPIDADEREEIIAGRDVRKPEEVAAVEEILLKMVRAVDIACTRASGPLRSRRDGGGDCAEEERRWA